MMNTNTNNTEVAEQTANHRKETPWGFSNSAREIAPGIIHHVTSSHGGIELSPERWEEFMAVLPGFRPWAREGWLEEDCDMSAAILVWPEFFTEKDLYFCIRYHASGINQKCIEAFLDTERGKALADVGNAYRASIADLWERGSMSTHGKGWRAWFRRVGDGAEKIVTLENYPEKHHYTSEELSALDVA